MPKRERRSTPRASIIIPAHNESAVIARCLRTLSAGADACEFEIIVVCNGCRDDTAVRARDAAPEAHVIVSKIASKTHALNLGDDAATVYPRIYLDADLAVSAQDLRELLQPIEKGEAMAAAGRMVIDDSASSYFVRAFYRVWRLNPYLDHGKFGGLFALSAVGHARLGRFPNVTSDDEYVRRLFTRRERARVEACQFTARAPLRLADLIKIRQRGLRGTNELARQGYKIDEPTGANSLLHILRRVAVRPRLWPDLPVFIAISLWVRFRARATRFLDTRTWERDDSSRVEATR